MSLRPSVSTAKPEISADHQLLELFSSGEFRSKFIQTQTAKRKSGVGRTIEIIDKIIYRLKELEARKVLIRKGVINDPKEVDRRFKKRNKRQWKEALSEVSVLRFRSKGKCHSFPIPDVNASEDTIMEFKRSIARFYPLEMGVLLKTEDLLTTREKAVSDKFDELGADLATRANSERFLRALAAWGKTRNAEGEVQECGVGYNAGVVHYYEYRAYRSKNKRYKGKPLKDFSHDDFIKETERASRLLNQDFLEFKDSDGVRMAAEFTDEEGQGRIIIQTADEFIVGVRRHADSCYKILTIVPVKGKKAISKFVYNAEKELRLDAEEDTRFNSLGNNRKLISLYVLGREELNIEYWNNGLEE